MFLASFGKTGKNCKGVCNQIWRKYCNNTRGYRAKKTGLAERDVLRIKDGGKWRINAKSIFLLNSSDISNLGPPT
jgi:hypothetical protein